MPPLPPPDDEDYDSEADSDFDASASPSSADESQESDAGTTTKKPKQDADGDVEMGSGDEGIIAQGKKKKKKRKKGTKGKGKKGEAQEEDDVDGDDDDEEGAGIRVRLRSGRGGVTAKKPAIPKASTATANIDEIWARMNNPSLQNSQRPAPEEPAEDSTSSTKAAPTALSTTAIEPPPPSVHEPEPTITIPHTYTFAGQTHTSTKTVPASSPAAKAYLASLKDKSPPPATTEPQTAQQGPALRRPLARKSLLEPNPTHYLTSRQQTLPHRQDLPTSIGGSGGLPTQASLAPGKENIPSPAISKPGPKKDKGEKLNTVEKSKLDWEAEVERLGLREELEKAEKSGASYLGRRDFLDRVEAEREERARKARMAGL